ncbi:MAG: tRNA (cytidine(34)-2'-O)-methyltransferase [Candidatus Muiribacteriaceae bacterium]
MFNIVLVEPEIPPNTGNVVRTAAATGCVVYLVGRLGFKTDDRHLKRAGLDYWKHVDVRYSDSLDDLMKENSDSGFWFFSRKADRIYTEADYTAGDFLVFGKESYGLPESVLEKNRKRSLRIPVINVRSLNLSTSAGIVVFEAFRQNGFNYSQNT